MASVTEQHAVASVTGQLELDRLAGFIHNEILQSLGVCVLEAELSRRFARKGQLTEAVAELDGALAALQSAIEQSRGALIELRRVTRWLGVADDAAPPADRSPAGATGRVQPDHLLRALGGCLAQAERCRDYYRQGNDDGAFEAVGGLLDRLDDVAAVFRQLMSDLRRARAATHSGLVPSA